MNDYVLLSEAWLLPSKEIKKWEKNEKTTNDDRSIWTGTVSFHGCWSGAKFGGSPGFHPNSRRRRRNRKGTYLNPGGTEDTRFEISLDTHSVDLDSYDLKALSSLRDDAGKVYQPTKVENKGSGHHRQLVLVFPKPAPGNKRLELVIKDIAGVKERSFVWDLQ